MCVGVLGRRVSLPVVRPDGFPEAGGRRCSAHAFRALRAAEERSSHWHLHWRMRGRNGRTRDIWCIRGQGGGEDGEMVEERAVVVNVVSEKAPSGSRESGHLRHHPTPTYEVDRDTTV